MREVENLEALGLTGSPGRILVRERLSGIPAFALIAALAVVCAGVISFTASPAEAQEGGMVEATGELIKPEGTSYMYGTHAITDESTGTTYALRSEEVDLDRHVGARVTISGSRVPGYEEGEISNGPALIQVSSVQTGDASPDEDQYSDEDGDTIERLPDTGGMGAGVLALAAGLAAGAFLLRRR